ncbi:hypothetical protein A2V56_03775 [Candidatus Woesebacteria bacterium RBG_19FT_COMBO_42_9]|uniref:Uncharacterized protein n=1 Tax=Candidatus Woesebacteria bacterium RBG_16_42_24 TaxID=1802485 RepID=A0A1F7XKF9_9BACT|nr:MAG: hypothetical protein A2V97_00465 [Candidatus Woesebacteria bacterium RBG_16_42_24]OGM17585.1 MAG: hypothetical protein A2V56_03775 [Candidatus Woesebacteria bacterium RBG_19FT_COMBO_42_9]OGM67092.1 MAG: hypothetical protein A2985_02460 [Candidatus Woesebacteria bacterium RIFCSPLOWO2_01_FULL_43_11]
MATQEIETARQRYIAGVSGVRLGDMLITYEEMTDQTSRWKHYSVDPGLGIEKLRLPDEQILRMLLHEVTPLEIKGEAEGGGPLVLNAHLKRFPYSINDERHYQAFSLRLAPASGRIESVSIKLGSSNNLDIVHFEGNSKRIVYELGYGETFRLELLFEALGEDLPLQPPTNYQESIYT